MSLFDISISFLDRCNQTPKKDKISGRAKGDKDVWLFSFATYMGNKGERE
jgi:hypothetical protein